MVGGWLCRRASPALHSKTPGQQQRQKAGCLLDKLQLFLLTTTEWDYPCSRMQQCTCTGNTHHTGSVSSTTGSPGWLLASGAAAADVAGQSASEMLDDARCDMLAVAGNRSPMSLSKAASAA